MRKLTGDIVLPHETPVGRAAIIRVEIRDVSRADALSTVVAEKRLCDMRLKPKGRIRFTISVPEVSPRRSLSIRVHLNLDGSTSVKSGDLLTTASYPVPSEGATGRVEVPVAVI